MAIHEANDSQMLCGYPVLAPTREHGSFEAWLTATRKMSFDKLADELVKALGTATEGEALEVLVEISAALVPQEGMRHGRE